MKHFFATTAAATGLMLSLGHASAATYLVDFTLDDNASFQLTTATGTTTLPFTPLHVTGEITTDGTLGALDATNFVSWEFQVGGFVAFSDTQAYGQSDDPANGITFTVENSGLDLFSATQTDLIAGFGSWSFGARLDDGTAVNTISFGVSNPREGLTFTSNTDFGSVSARFSASDNTFVSGTVGTATIAPVPLPAGLPLMVGALALLGITRTRRA